MKLRKMLVYFFDTYETAWELFMVGLAIIFVIIGFLPDLFHFSDRGIAILGSIDSGITVFFILEFVTRISISSFRLSYLKEHWLDLVAILPVIRWLRAMRLVRVLRLSRITRLARVIRLLKVLGFNVSQFARLNGLQWILLLLTGIMLASSGLLFYYERGVNEKINTYWDALYASLVTWMTPGYGDIAPVTTAGHIFGLVLILSGLITWGILIANLAAFLTSRKEVQGRVSPAIREIQEKLRQFDHLDESELIALRGALNSLIADKLGEKPDYTL